MPRLNISIPFPTLEDVTDLRHSILGAVEDALQELKDDEKISEDTELDWEIED